MLRAELADHEAAGRFSLVEADAAAVEAWQAAGGRPPRTLRQ